MCFATKGWKTRSTHDDLLNASHDGEDSEEPMPILGK